MRNGIATWFVDWLSGHTKQKCWAFGGAFAYDQPDDEGYEVRLCTKNRWHIGSHAYEAQAYTMSGEWLHD